MGLLDDSLELRNQALLDERRDIEAADAAKKAKVENVELESAEVEVSEDTEATELRQKSDLLELEQGVDVEAVADEELLEAANVEVVEGGELGKGLEVEAVDSEKVLEVLVAEVEVVEGTEVNAGALLSGGRGAGRGSSGESGKSADEDGRGLHFDWV